MSHPLNNRKQPEYENSYVDVILQELPFYGRLALAGVIAIVYLLFLWIFTLRLRGVSLPKLGICNIV